MSETKIKVPEGMLATASNTAREIKLAILHQGPREVDALAQTKPEFIASQILEAALRWLAENPIVPTVEQCNEIARMWFAKHDFNATPRDFIAEWQRRMFAAPEPEDIREMTTYDCLDCKKSWKQQLNEVVASCVYCQSSNTKRIATCSAVREYRAEPEVPEEVRSLLRMDIMGDWVKIHASIIESFRRGQQSK